MPRVVPAMLWTATMKYAGMKMKNTRNLSKNSRRREHKSYGKRNNF